MTITQTVDVPVNRRLTIEVPHEIPTGRTILTFTPASAEAEASAKKSSSLPGGSYSTIEEALQAAEEKARDPNRKPISRLFGTLKPGTFGDPVAYQRAIRDEWD